MKTLRAIMLVGGLSFATALGQSPNVTVGAGKTTPGPAPQATEPGDAAGTNATDVRAPDADARRVDVTVNEGKIEMPTELEPGKTAFVVKNNSNTTQTF